MKKTKTLVAPTIADAAYRALSFDTDVKLILEKEKASATQLATALGVTRWRVYQWQRGALPAEPIVLLTVIKWADRLRAS